MNKRNGCLFLAALLAFSVSGCKGAGSGKDDLRIYGLLPTEKYMRDAEIAREEKSELSFAGMKNETHSAQLMFTSDKKVNGFDLTGGELVLEDGTAKIDASRIDIYAEKYIEIYNPYYQSDSYLSDAGWYPDALVPIDRYKARSEDRVNSGENQALWVDVRVPGDAAAGIYKGTFTLTVNQTKKAIPVTLKVYDVTLPEEVHNPTAFDIWYQNIAYGEGNNMDEGTYERYFEYLWTKRLNCETLPPAYTKSMASWLDYIEALAVNPKVTAYRIPIAPFVNIVQDKIAPAVKGKYTEAEINAEKVRIKNELKAQLKQILDRNFALRSEGSDIDLCDKALYYYEDEPPLGSARMQSVRVFCEVLNAAKKELLAEYAAQFAANPDLKTSFEDIHEICPSLYMQPKSASEDIYDYGGGLFVSVNEDGTPNYDLSDGLRFWCPEMYKFDSAEFRATVRARQAYGEKVWWYLCVSNTPRPSYYVESLPLNIRMQQWMQYDYNVEGILYWDVAHYSAERDNYGDLHYNEYGGGDGILLYPGERYGMKVPVSSWRLEQIRLGQQDYEIFYLLGEELEKTDSGITAQQLVSAYGKNFYKGATVLSEADGQDFENARIRLLEILELFRTGKSDEAVKLIEKTIKE